MARNSEDPTLSYLNKGQVYTLTILDSKPPGIGQRVCKYRAFIRVSFDQDQPRKNPVGCWQLWRDARTVNQSPRNKRLPFAIEYAGVEGSNLQLQIEQTQFDGFCIIWIVNPLSSSNICKVPIRFNFLSTDFTRSKGVRGMPVRLCAKIEEIIPPDENMVSESPEICFCKLQLFRDHGAERKMSNDNENLKKAIEKLKQKRSSGISKPVVQKRKSGRMPQKIIKESALSSLSNGDMKQPSHDGLDSRLLELEEMARSTQSRTILALRGSGKDDPDLYPVHMPKSPDRYGCFGSSPANSKVDGSECYTPTSHFDAEHPAISEKTIVRKERMGSTNSTGMSGQASTEQPLTLGVPFYLSTSNEQYISDQFIVACFYVRLMLEKCEQIYRAIYLSERTAQNLVQAISRKYGIIPVDNFDIFHVSDKGLKILVDDDFVQQIPEGQHMTIQLDGDAGLGGSKIFCEMQLLY